MVLFNKYGLTVKVLLVIFGFAYYKRWKMYDERCYNYAKNKNVIDIWLYQLTWKTCWAAL